MCVERVESTLTPPTNPPNGPEAAPPVLVVDDERDTADTFVMLLTTLGYPARAAYDADAALQAARSLRPRVVFLDLAMPRVNGLALARQLRQLPGMERALLVCVSGYGREADQQQSREAGCDYYLLKPTDPETIRKILVSQESRR
jgi:two-component system CheB/CheR fusion protein